MGITRDFRNNETIEDFMLRLENEIEREPHEYGFEKIFAHNRRHTMVVIVEDLVK